MKLTTLFVHNVTIIVLNVKPIQDVLFVLKEEKTFQTAYVSSIPMIMPEIVNHVLTNVKDVTIPTLNVKDVLDQTELMLQPVIVNKDIGKTVSLRPVQNVLVNVTLVLTVALIV